MGKVVDALDDRTGTEERHAEDAARRAAAAAERAVADERRLTTASTDLHAAAHSTGRALSDHGVSVQLAGLTAASALGTTEAETQPPRSRRGWRTCARNGCPDGVVVRLWSRRRGAEGSGAGRPVRAGFRHHYSRAPTARRRAVSAAETAARTAAAAADAAAEESRLRERELLRAVELAHERRGHRVRAARTHR